MANPEVQRLRRRVAEYRKTHPQYASSAPKRPPHRKHLHTKRLLTGNEVCYYCGKKLTKHNATQDHLLPVVYGGTNDANNLVWACEACNKRKGSKLLSEFLEEDDNDVH